MNDTASKISLVVGGKRLSSWSNASVNVDIGDGVSDFSFTSFQEIEGDNLFAQQEVQVFVDNKLVITGYIDCLKPSFSAQGTKISIEGKSKSIDFVDCSPLLKGAYAKNTDLISLARMIAKQFNISIQDLTNQHIPIPYIAENQGETCFDLIKRQTANLGFIIYPMPNGDIAIGKPKGKQLLGGFKFDPITKKSTGHIVSGSTNIDFSDRYSEYIVKIQDDMYKNQANVVSRYKDETIKRYRPKIITVDGDANNSEKRARYHAQRASGEGTSVSLTTKTPYTDQNDFIEVGKTLYVNHQYLRVDQLMLVKSVTYSDNAKDGFSCEINLVDPKAYNLQKSPVNNSKPEMDVPNANF